MNATERLIEAVEEVFRLSQLDYDGIDILVQRAAANQEVKEALAAAKEERVLTMQDVMLACGELNKRERVAVQWVLDRCRPSKEGQQRSPTWLGHCSGCTDPHSEGTHQMGTIEHPDIDNAKGSHATGSSAVIGNVRERWKELGYDNPERVEERFRNDPWRLFYNGWVEGRVPLITGSDKYCHAKGSGLTVDEVMEALDNVGRHEGWGLVTVAKGALSKALEDLAENSSDNLRTDQWVSVEDRLPNDKVRVLAWGNDWHRVGDCYLEVGDDGHATWMWFDDDDPVSHGNVTHWMPLPAPPDNTTP